MDETVNILNIDFEAYNRKLNKEERQKRQKEIGDIIKILKLPEGRRFLWRVLERCGIFRSSFSSNSLQSAFFEGKRNIGLELLMDINEADDNAFTRMHGEYVSALKSNKEVSNGRDANNTN